jgi:hypothetical protein
MTPTRPSRTARLRASAALAVIAALPLVASGQASTVHLVALSKTAVAITGDITLRERGGAVTQITFANGTTMKLAGGHDGVYTVAAFGNPVLRNGNRLCGTNAPKRLTITEGRDGTYQLSAYTAKTMTDATLCAIFSYEKT